MAVKTQENAVFLIEKTRTESQKYRKPKTKKNKETAASRRKQPKKNQRLRAGACSHSAGVRA
jgi:hypothetical protein